MFWSWYFNNILIAGPATILILIFIVSGGVRKVCKVIVHLLKSIKETFRLPGFIIFIIVTIIVLILFFWIKSQFEGFLK